jgi:hypothetical protein
MRLFLTPTLAVTGARWAHSGHVTADQPIGVSQARLLLNRARADLARAASRRSQWPLPPLPISSIIAAPHHPSDGLMMVVPVLSGMAIVGLLLWPYSWFICCSPCCRGQWQDLWQRTDSSQRTGWR